LKDPERVRDWGFKLTPVSWRKEELQRRLERSKRLVSGEELFELYPTGEDGVSQMKALLGLGGLHTNVNMPNRGQIPNLPLGAVVETNAYFASDGVTPVMAGSIPHNVHCLMAQTVLNQECIVEAGLKKNPDLAFQALFKDPLVTLSLHDAKHLFDTMLKNTAAYLEGYDIGADY
jgi:alpha-galactosidase